MFSRAVLPEVVQSLQLYQWFSILGRVGWWQERGLELLV